MGAIWQVGTVRVFGYGGTVRYGYRYSQMGTCMSTGTARVWVQVRVRGTGLGTCMGIGIADTGKRQQM